MQLDIAWWCDTGRCETERNPPRPTPTLVSHQRRKQFKVVSASRGPTTAEKETMIQTKPFVLVKYRLWFQAQSESWPNVAKSLVFNWSRDDPLHKQLIIKHGI
jgi:hypothetical protein